MSILDSVIANNFILPVLNLQIDLGNYVLIKIIYFLEYSVGKLSTGE